MREIFVSTGAFKAPRLEDIFSTARRFGIEHIELSSGVPHEPDVLGLVEKHGADFRFLIHNYFPAPKEPFVLNLAAGDTSVRERSLEHCRRALDLTRGVNAPFYAAHAGYALHPDVDDLGHALNRTKAIPRQEAYERFFDNVRHVLGYAKSLGVHFYIENNVVAPFNAPNGQNDYLLLAEPEEMIRFAKKVDDSSFGYLMDVGHLNVSAQTLGFDRETALESLAPYIRAFHLSDNDGSDDTNQPFNTDAWFLPWLRKCPDTTIVIEAYSLSNTDLNICIDAVRHWTDR